MSYVILVHVNQSLRRAISQLNLTAVLIRNTHLECLSHKLENFVNRMEIRFVEVAEERHHENAVFGQPFVLKVLQNRSTVVTRIMSPLSGREELGNLDFGAALRKALEADQLVVGDSSSIHYRIQLQRREGFIPEKSMVDLLR